MFFLIKTQEWTFIFFSPQLFSSVTFETVGESKVRPFFCFILGYFLKHLLTVHLRLALNSAFLLLPPVLGLQACAAMPSRDDSLNYRILTSCKLKCEYLILILNLGFFFFPTLVYERVCKTCSHKVFFWRHLGQIWTQIHGEHESADCHCFPATLMSCINISAFGDCLSRPPGLVQWGMWGDMLVLPSTRCVGTTLILFW